MLVPNAQLCFRTYWLCGSQLRAAHHQPVKLGKQLRSPGWSKFSSMCNFLQQFSSLTLPGRMKGICFPLLPKLKLSSVLLSTHRKSSLPTSPKGNSSSPILTQAPSVCQADACLDISNHHLPKTLFHFKAVSFICIEDKTK